MGDQGSASTMVEIAAARALQWNVDFDRGLRSSKPGAQCEAIMKLGSQLVRWSHDCVVTASSANLFKLDPGQDRLCANAILLRLAETFRSGDSFIRVCVLKVLMLEFKGRRWIGEPFTGDSYEKILKTKKLTWTSSSHSRAVRRIRAGAEGLLTKKRIENHVEMLRRVKCVIDSGDPTSRALAIRVLGCLADLGKDSLDVHNLILQAVHSPHHQEVSAALFAMGCLSELSDEFAGHALEKVVEMVNAMETPPAVKLLAVRLFAKLGHSPVLSLQAHEMGRRSMLRYPIHEIVTTMLISLTMLAAESSVIMSNQVDLLLTYVACDPRMNVRAIALKCLGKLIPQVFCCIDSGDEIFNGVFSVVQDTALPSALHVIALRVIQKLFHQCAVTMEFRQLLQIISWIELAALRDIWPVVSQALSLLVDVVRDLMKFKVKSASSEHRRELMDLSTRVCFLLCDQVSITGSAVRSVETVLIKSGSSLIKEEEMIILAQVKIATLSVLLVKLVQGYPPVGSIVVDSVAGIMGALGRRNIDQQNEFLNQEGMEMNMGHNATMEVEDGGQVPKECAGASVDTMTPNRFVYGGQNVILRELGRCLSACISFIEYNAKNIEDVHRRIHELTSALAKADTWSSPLSPVLQALMKANLLHKSLTFLTDAKGSELEKLADDKNSPREQKVGLLVQSKITIERIGANLMEGGNFGMTYWFGKQAALCALWEVAQPAFDSLVDKVSSEGCYFWLGALSYQAMAESVLHLDSPVMVGVSEKQIDGSTCRVLAGKALVGKTNVDRSRDDACGTGEESALKGDGNSIKVEESNLGKLGKAAAYAIPLLHMSISSLSAGVCLERSFEFQRWVLTLRLEVLECASELVGLLAYMSSFDTDAGLIDLEDEGKDDDMKSLSSALKASREKVEILASRFMKLSEEYDLLSISFMGIDQRSVEMIARAALFCSLLTFCSVGAISEQPTSSQQLADSGLNSGAVALDLFNRLQQTESEDWDHLLSYAIQSGAGVMGGRSFGTTLVTAPQDMGLVDLSRSAITSVLDLQNHHSQFDMFCGTRSLQKILEECLRLPWLYPPFFFCTRPRTGVDLFLAQAGSSPGETDDLSVLQGSALALSLCLQIVNTPPDLLFSSKRLICALSVEQAESMVKVGDDINVGLTGFVVNHPIHPALLEKLIWYSDEPAPLNTDHEFGSWTTTGQNGSYETNQLAPDLVFAVSVDSKGQGFASCTLDVSAVQCGEYQLMLTCICRDNGSGQWILPLLSLQPNFRII